MLWLRNDLDFTSTSASLNQVVNKASTTSTLSSTLRYVDPVLWLVIPIVAFVWVVRTLRPKD